MGKHTWAVITEPCGPGMKFTSCDTFRTGGSHLHPAAKLFKTKSRPCPKCRPWAFDPYMMRVVDSYGGGIKWGTGPEKDDLGCEVKFGSGCVVF